MSDAVQAARRIAYRYLARREYSQSELVQVLCRKGCAQDLAAATVQQFAHEGLQSDTRFAQSLMRTRVSQGYGPLRLQQELAQHGVLADVDGDIDWQVVLANVLEKKYGDEIPRFGPTLAKCQRFLQYRGFTHEQIRQGLKNYAN